VKLRGQNDSDVSTKRFVHQARIVVVTIPIVSATNCSWCVTIHIVVVTTDIVTRTILVSCRKPELYKPHEAFINRMFCSGNEDISSVFMIHTLGVRGLFFSLGN